jgi:hypothetical protein
VVTIGDHVLSRNPSSNNYLTKVTAVNELEITVEYIQTLSGIQEAPMTGTPFVRQNGGWANQTIGSMKIIYSPPVTLDPGLLTIEFDKGQKEDFSSNALYATSLDQIGFAFNKFHNDLQGKGFTMVELLDLQFENGTTIANTTIPLHLYVLSGSVTSSFTPTWDANVYYSIDSTGLVHIDLA